MELQKTNSSLPLAAALDSLVLYGFVMEPVHDTRTFLPAQSEFEAWLDKIYTSRVLTWQGPILRELEDASALASSTGQTGLALVS